MNKTDKHIFHLFRVCSILIVCIGIGLLMSILSDIVYTNTANKHWRGKRYQQRKNNPVNQKMVDSCIELLQTGDLVVRRGDDMTSYMLSRLNTSDKRYSHCGIVSVEIDGVYVYHSIGGEDNLDEKLRKDKAEQWLSPANNLAFGIYRYSVVDSLKQEYMSAIQQFYMYDIMFDMDFDLATDDRMYCSEMIFKAIKWSISDNIDLSANTRHGKRYIGVDDLYRNRQTVPVCQIKFK